MCKNDECIVLCIQFLLNLCRRCSQKTFSDIYLSSNTHSMTALSRTLAIVTALWRLHVVVALVDDDPDTSSIPLPDTNDVVQFCVGFSCGVCTGILFHEITNQPECCTAPVCACCAFGGPMAVMLHVSRYELQSFVIGWTSGLLTGYSAKCACRAIRSREVLPTYSESRSLRSRRSSDIPYGDGKDPEVEQLCESANRGSGAITVPPLPLLYDPKDAC